jgi:hypothetical protein
LFLIRRAETGKSRNPDLEFMWGLIMKLILQLLLASLTFLVGITIASGSVVINEVELNPSGEASEWVELYNAGEDSVNIGRWSVSIEDALPTSGKWIGVIPIPRDSTIQAGGFFVVEGDDRWVHGNNGTVFLRTDSWAEVDRTPPLGDEDGNDFSWSRYPNGLDTDRRSDWAFIKSTPGAENSLRLVSGL